MTDYLGPLTLGTTSATTYQIVTWQPGDGAVSVEVIARGTTAATLTAAIEALVAQLVIGNTYVHYFPGSTSAMLYRVTGSTKPMVSEDTGPLAFWASVGVTLAVTGPPAGALTTLYTAEAVSAPASLSLAALLGTHPTALDVTVDDSAGTDMHSVICALAPTAVSDSKWLKLASALTWTSMTDPGGSPADCWGAVSRTTTSATYQTAPLDTSAYPAGKYRLFVRAKQSAGTGYVKDSQNDTAVAITRTTMHLTQVGDLDLPAYDTATGTAANITLSVESDGAATLTVNAFLLIPLSWGFFTWHHSTVTSECDQLDVGPSGIYVDGVCDTTYLRGGVLIPKRLACHAGTMVATANPTGDTWPSDWSRQDTTYTVAESGRFKFTGSAAGASYISPTISVATRPLVVPGEWYEFTLVREMTAYTSGSLNPQVRWYDVDGNQIGANVNMATWNATDAAPTALAYYAKAPVHAARGRFLVYTGSAHNLTCYVADVVMRRCPLRLIVVAEDAAGALTSNAHPVAVTVKYVPRYEVSR